MTLPIHQQARKYEPEFVALNRCFCTYSDIADNKIKTLEGLEKLINDYLSENKFHLPNITTQLGFTVSFFEAKSVFFFLSIDTDDKDCYEGATSFFKYMGFEGTLLTDLEKNHKHAVKHVRHESKTTLYKLCYIELKETTVQPMLAFSGK